MPRAWGDHNWRKQKTQSKQWIVGPRDRKTQWLDETDDWPNSEKVRKGCTSSDTSKKNQGTRRVCQENGVKSQWSAESNGSIS